ncbi:hypothetical protein K2F45_07100 [Sphingobacterium siyangense]|uniref:hypothetical protein n=1 Tax=Sphingobacterium TaxID=28453 RepID=UPI0009583283|nr:MULTISPECIES: hypothetical protein [Sphingobacterium]APU96361.1 hypothetical protein BV902_08360 [Sphingobacterium sp. B29]UQA76754.1 hypothetical protein K2F45_07100 [Sphingobacterium siyangense]
MDFEEINRILFFTLNDICPIGTSRISMMSIDDRYAGYPFLRFRFKEKDKNDVIYSKIRDAVKDFKGLLSWEMITFNDVPNYLILPTYVYSEGRRASGDLNEHLIAKYGENLYRKMIDQAIVDIPNLAKSIRDKFHEQ